MVSRADRDAVIALIDQYTSDAITSGDLDEVLQSIGDRTEDGTVAQAAFWLWGCYDDLVDHRVVASREEWDFLQRVRLLLSSDAVVEYAPRRQVTWRQVAAWACMAAFAGAILRGGCSYWAAAIPLGVASMGIARLPGPRPRGVPPEALSPFASMSDVRRVRRLAPAFAKRRYRTALARRRVRGSAAELVIWLPLAICWVAFSPLVAAFQALPEQADLLRVVTPAEEP